MANIDIRLLQLINAKALNRIEEQYIEISPPLDIPPRIEVNGLESNTEITITARPEGKYKNSKTARYRRNTLQDEFDGYDIDPTAGRRLWDTIIFSEMIGIVEKILSLFCIDPYDADMESFGHIFPQDSRGRRQIDLSFIVDGKLTVTLRPTQDNYYYNGPATLIFTLGDITGMTRAEEDGSIRYLENTSTRLQDGV